MAPAGTKTRRTRTMRTRNFLIAGLVALAAVGGATALAVSGGNSNPVPAGQSPRTVVGTQLASAPEATPTPPTAFPQEAAAHLAMLRRAAQPQDAFPQGGGGMLRDRGANLGLARRVNGPTPYWLVPEPDGNVCFVDAAGGGGCLSAGDLAEAGTIATVECGPGVPDGKLLLRGVVPDGVGSVTLTSRLGTTTAPVTENGWEALVTRVPEDERPFQVSWQDGSASKQFDIPVSPDVNQRCG
jgi:hypothetical protein